MDLVSSSHLIAVAAVLVLIIFWKLWRVREKHQSYGSKNGKLSAPEPSGCLPIIGHLHLLRKEKTLARTLAQLSDKYGSIFMLRLGIRRAIVVSSHEVIKECFTTHDRVLASRPKSTRNEYMTYNNATLGAASYGPYWREMRKTAMIHLLSSHRMKSLKQVHVSEVKMLIKELYLLSKECDDQKNPGSLNKINMSECFEHLLMNMITRMIAGKRYFSCANSDEEEGQRIRKIMKEFVYFASVLLPSDLIPFLSWMKFVGSARTMKRVSKEFDSLMQGWIEEHKLKRVKVGEEEDFIDVMLSILDDDLFGHPKDNVIKATAMTLIIAGSDTTSITLTWILSNLLNNKRTLELAQEELDRKVGRNRCVEDSDIDNLVYLKAIVKETLRLYPPGPLGSPHLASEDCCIAGYHIPKGTHVMANLWKLHRDPKVWSNPEEFKPERFLTSEASRVDVYFGQNFEYIPFGSGRRSCPGIYFATQAIHLALAGLLQAFNFTTPSNLPVDMTEGFGIIMPKATPLEIQITPRLSPELYKI